MNFPQEDWYKSLEAVNESTVLDCHDYAAESLMWNCFIWTGGDAFQRNSDNKGRDGNGSKA
jgi:hypothetical protein